MSTVFSHEALTQTTIKPLVFTAFSKHLFYYRMFISKYVLEQGKVPLNPFMNFDYFLLDTVDRNVIREGNNNLIKRADELWVFGPVSNGVLAEIRLAQSLNKPIRYFAVEKPHQILPVKKENVEMEDDVSVFKTSL